METEIIYSLSIDNIKGKSRRIKISKEDIDKVTKAFYGITSNGVISMRELEEALKKCDSTNR